MTTDYEYGVQWSDGHYSAGITTESVAAKLLKGWSITGYKPRPECVVRRTLPGAWESLPVGEKG